MGGADFRPATSVGDPPTVFVVDQRADREDVLFVRRDERRFGLDRRVREVLGDRWLRDRLGAVDAERWEVQSRDRRGGSGLSRRRRRHGRRALLRGGDWSGGATRTAESADDRDHAAEGAQREAISQACEHSAPGPISSGSSIRRCCSRPSHGCNEPPYRRSNPRLPRRT